MKKSIIFIAVLLLSAEVCAQVTFQLPQKPPQPVTAVIQTLSSTGTIVGINISSFSATSVIVSTSAGFRFVEVENLDASASVFCAERASVSTSSSALVGFRIAPGASKSFSIVPYTDFFCLNDSGTGSKWCSVIRGR